MIDQRASETGGEAMPRHESDRQAVQNMKGALKRHAREVAGLLGPCYLTASVHQRHPCLPAPENVDKDHIGRRGSSGASIRVGSQPSRLSNL